MIHLPNLEAGGFFTWSDEYHPSRAEQEIRKLGSEINITSTISRKQVLNGGSCDRRVRFHFEHHFPRQPVYLRTTLTASCDELTILGKGVQSSPAYGAERSVLQGPFSFNACSIKQERVNFGNCGGGNYGWLYDGFYILSQVI